MYSYRFTREYLFHYFLCKYTYRYVNITIPLPPHLLSASHFFSAVVGGESYIFKKRSPSFLWFAHTCKAWYYRIKTGGGGWRIFALFIGHTSKMHHVHLLQVIAIIGINIQSQQMHTFYLSKLRCGFPSPKINEVAGTYSMHG